MNLVKRILTLITTYLVVISLYSQVENQDSIDSNSKYDSPNIYEVEEREHDDFYFDSYFMPGAGYGLYQPSKSDSIGFFHGVVVKYLFYRNVSQSDRSGPSLIDIYSKLGIFNSTEEGINQLLLYSLGVGLSFERNPRRLYFIPFFGLEIGGFSQKSYGTTLQFTPTFGTHFVVKRNITLGFSIGYMYPIQNFEHLAGWYGDFSLNFVLW